MPTTIGKKLFEGVDVSSNIFLTAVLTKHLEESFTKMRPSNERSKLNGETQHPTQGRCKVIFQVVEAGRATDNHW